MYDNLSRVVEVDINEILPNRFQPRIQFDEEEILELSDSIKEHGVIQPLVVRTIGDKYEIIAGERRYKASVLAGKETVPVIIKNLNDKDSAEVALIENIQRKNLTPIEEALSYKKILDMGYITQENLATKLGKSQSAVANKIRLLNLSDEVQEALLENRISERHARSLLKLTTSKQQNEMLNRIINERLTVRRADEEIEKIKNNTSDESNDDTQKIIEKGEIDMNNNMFGMPNVPENQQSMPNFDIFGTGVQQTVEQQQPVVNSVPETPVVPQTTPSFDIFGGSTPVMNGMTSAPVVESSEPESVPTMDSVPSIPVFNQPAEVQPVVETVIPTATPVVPEIPVMQPAMPEMPTMNSILSTPVVESSEPESVPTMDSVPSIPVFNQPAEVQPVVEPVIPTAAPVVPEIPVMQAAMPEMPTMDSISSVPQTAPIMESPVLDNTNQITQQSENLFSFGNTNINIPEQQPEAPTTPEFKMPEPIIVTDYSKQYDPVMPQSLENVVPTVDFKEVINAIRECSNKIEKYGFKIDVEEYDLANLYQVIFKIEK